MDLATIEDYMRIAGADPEATFRQALDNLGLTTTGPDSNGQWSSQCPAHEDRSPSLHWGQTSNHIVKFHCFADCSGDEIMKALGLRWYQLRPVKYDFDYFDAEGTYLFTVRRMERADGEKRISQHRRFDDGTEEDGNGLEKGQSVLWLEPELESFAEDARAHGQKIELWLPEGEKDTIAIAGSGALGEWDFVTTAPGGAGAWKPEHTGRLVGLAERDLLRSIVLVCDPDKAGFKRGFELRDEFEAALPDIPVRVISPDDGGDITDLCDQYGRRWTEHCRELTGNEISEALEEGSAVTGFMCRYPLGPGAKPGRMGMAIRVEGDKESIRPVLAAEIEPVSIWDGGWVVRVVPPRREATEVVLTHQDLASKASFDKWMIKARVAMVPRCGIGTSEVAQSVGLWLDWIADVRNVERVTVSEYLTWVDPASGEPSRVAGADGAEPVWVGPENERGSGVRWIGADRAGTHWGRNGTEVEAAWAWARALTFGDEETVASVAGWAGAMVLAPWVGRWMPTKPGLAVIAPSGSGKTYGAPRLLLQLAGCDGNATSSVAGLRRRLSQGGVSSIQWIDDSSILDDYHLKEILRVATSQGEHILANPDGGAGATSSVRLVGCIAVSAEGVGWMEEVAMQDRFLNVRPANPQGRMSLRVGYEDQLQWPDVQQLMSEYDGELTRVAGWSVEGLARYKGQIARWVEQVGAPRGRSDVAAFTAAVGARAVAAWLYGVMREAGDAWPGKRPTWTHEKYNGWKWLVEAADAKLEEARSVGPRYNTLVNSVLPAVLRHDLTTVTGKGIGALVLHDVDGTSETAVRNSVYSQVQMGENLAVALPLVLVDRDDHVWVWINGTAAWYERAHRMKAESRINGPKALEDQCGVVEHNPEWAHWVEHKSGGRKYERPGIRVGKREMGRNRAVYRRLSKEVSSAILGAV